MRKTVLAALGMALPSCAVYGQDANSGTQSCDCGRVPRCSKVMRLEE